MEEMTMNQSRDARKRIDFPCVFNNFLKINHNRFSKYN